MRRLTVNVLVMFFTLALGIFVTTVRLGSIKASAVDRETEEYAVYSALINSFHSQAGVDPLLVASQTISTTPQEHEVNEKEFIKYYLPDATAKETFNDYKFADREPLNIGNRLNVRRYILIDNQEAKSYFENRETSLSLRQKYPNSSGRIIMLSRVGLNRKMNEALVYSWAYCGGDCGGGGYYLLRKEDGVWKVQHRKIWIS